MNKATLRKYSLVIREMNRKPNTGRQFVRETRLYETLEDGSVKCGTCERRCRIHLGNVGFCQTRQNINSTLFTLVFGRVASLSVNPIEKKPLHQFYPGSAAVTLGTSGCSFNCPWCQNYELSRARPEDLGAQYFGPEDLVEFAVKNRVPGLSYSFNEPTLQLEHALAAFPQAKEAGLYNTYVTNGYMTYESLDLLIDHGLDAMNIDIKGNRDTVRKYCGGNVEYVWRNARMAQERGIHIEITTLVIPGVNDNESCLREIAKRIKEELGENTPFHVSRYFPQYKYNRPPTPLRSLERARKIALEEGLKFVYIGNVPGHPSEHTYCPSCSELVIKRYSFFGTECKLTLEKTCPTCNEPIPVVGTWYEK